MKRRQERGQERIEFARDQRQQANEFARDMWQMVRAGRMLGEKFRREHPLGIYTLDFVCLKLKLVVEVDGKHHFTDEGKRRDEARDAFLRAQGFTILRIPGYRVTQEPGPVRKEIENAVRNLRARSPSPRSGARGARVVRATLRRQLSPKSHDHSRQSLQSTS